MTDELQNQPGEMPNPTPASEPASETVAISKAEFDKLQAALKEANREAASRRKRLDELEQAEAKRKEAEMSETQRLQAQLEAATAKAAKLEREGNQRDIAARVGLPAAFAGRIQGETPEDMEADAKALLAAMPRSAQPNISPTNPPAGTPTETEAQKRQRLLGTNAVNLLDPANVRRAGGGVFFNDKD